ncbi:hypothetical protein LTR10_013034 [Elasticomyces elasticus]|uniref:Major facilitator superfamily (MFS) profile domain-containing protein n=1 Tax=Exophiala sideris TaxID=1016849 RepID=A0ABR0JAN5_9EURO|nr:hypothetical protein LTR10_013034 [Elasticomyces elasticus]KAK5030410.1 hypothetical protein LTS07_005194 [Exophiala sideris]KAK5038463.1 hypothetical protein LTR13_004210 [Exophiala sideris]KAK5060346.1 hypothetical protein LTR69_005663 [Exophiala sideris]KAK5183256.1 hypothetical protein LTR44_004257 [Eurotiomycetes sp. CCFEE 6388]
MATEKAPDVTPAAPLDQTISIDPKIAVSDQHDVAAKILADNGDALNGTFSAEEDLLSICATLNGIDKVSISTAALYGLREDTHLVGSQYSWVGSIIYFGGLLAVLPTSWAMHRFPIGKYYAVNIIAWGAIQMIMASCTNYGGLMVCRFLLGALEACSTPCITIMYTMFYKKSEQPLRNTITFGAYSSVINGLIGYGIGFIPTGSTSIETWKWLFIVLGGVTVIFGTWIFFYLPSNPGDARWLSDKEKAMVVLRVRENQTGIENKIWKWYQFKEAMFDFKTWLLFFYIIGVTVPNGGLNTFNGLVIKNLGFTSHTTTLLQMPTGMFSTLAALVASFFAMRTIRFRTLIMAVVLLVPITGTALNIAYDSTKTGPRLAGVYMIYTFYAGYMIALSMYQANTAGHTKKVTISYTMYVAYAIGNIIGPQTFIANQAPKYTGGIVAMLVCYCVCICLALALGFAYFANNKRRGPDMIGAEHSESEFLDLTDKENKSFKYTS